MNRMAVTMAAQSRKSLENNHRYSELSMAEFKGAMGAKVENIERDMVEMKKTFTDMSAANTLLLQGITTNLATLMSSGSIQAQQTSKEVNDIEGRMMLLEDKEKTRKIHSNKMAAVFGAIGGAILSFLTHFVSSWLSRPK
jgi:hypothetical protein